MSTQNIDIILSAEDNATKAIQSADESVKKLTKSMGTSSKFGGTMQSAIDSASQSLQKIGVVSGIAGAGLTGILGSTVRSAMELENSLKGLQSIVVGTGGDFNKAKGIIQKFTADGLVSTAEAATSLKNLIAKGFSLDQAEEMMNRFKDAASFGRQASLELGQAIAGATEGIKNENSMLVDNAGVTKNVSLMVAEYAKAHGLKETALTAAQKNEAIYQGILKETTHQVGDAIKYADGYSGQVARLWATQTKLSQTIWGILIPALTRLMEVVTPILTGLKEWVDWNPKLSETIIAVVIGVTGLGVALGALGVVLPVISAGIAAVTTVAAAVPTVLAAVAVGAKTLGTALAFLTATPIWALIAVLAILGGALLAVYQNWDTIKPKLLEFWGSLSSSVRGVVEDMSTWIKAKLDSVVGYFSEKVKALANMAREARQWVADIASSVGDKAGNLAENIGGTVLKGLDGFRANGWPVKSGGSYIVGERWPELFTPSTSGNITPNDKLGGASISVSIGNITLGNGWDPREVGRIISEEIARQMQLGKKGIYA